MRDTALWKTPRSPRVFIVSTELLCVTWLIVANFVSVPDVGDLRRFVLLICLAALYAELGDRIERLRRFAGYVDNSVFVEGSSQWCLAAALIFEPGLAGVFVAAPLRPCSAARASSPGCPDLPTGVHRSDRGARCDDRVDGRQLLRGRAHRSRWHALDPAGSGPRASSPTTLVQEGLIVAVLWLIRRPVQLRQITIGANERAMEYATLGTRRTARRRRAARAVPVAGGRARRGRAASQRAGARAAGAGHPRRKDRAAERRRLAHRRRTGTDPCRAASTPRSLCS